MKKTLSLVLAALLLLSLASCRRENDESQGREKAEIATRDLDDFQKETSEAPEEESPKP